MKLIILLALAILIAIPQGVSAQEIMLVEDKGQRMYPPVEDKKGKTCQDVNKGKPELWYYTQPDDTGNGYDVNLDVAYSDYLEDLGWWMDLHERPCKIQPETLD